MMTGAAVQTNDLAGVALSEGQAELVMAQLPEQLQAVARRFNQITGLSVVAAIGAGGEGNVLPTVVIPPIHPLCAELSAGDVRARPCAREWVRHIREGIKKRCSEHACRLGLRCGCVPVVMGSSLVGLCKLVAGPEVSDQEFSLAMEVLEALVDGASNHLQAVAMAEELMVLRERVSELQSTHLAPQPHGAARFTGRWRRGATGALSENRSLVGRALEYLGQSYTDSELTLGRVASALDVNDKYLANVFSRHVGKRMRTYLVELRVRRACELLLETDWQIKRIAMDSGFSDLAQFGRCFRRYVGVSAGEYRRIFSASD